jgi:AhpD family alkylhydroperoxidase
LASRGWLEGGFIVYDLKNFAKLKKLGALAPAAMDAFMALTKTATAEGAIPVKYKELMAVAVAVTTQCPYCIDYHTKEARKAGATDEELAEAILVAAALRAGGAVTHGTHCFE